MKGKVTDKLLLNLSLYLDNQLSKQEMLEIEELIKADPEVSAIFDSLRSTKKVLRNTPRIKRRKNFALSPDQVKQVKKQSGWLNSMRMVSTFAVILLMVVFTQNMVGDWSPPAMQNFAADVSDDSMEMGMMEMDVEETGTSKTAEDVGDETADVAEDLDADSNSLGDANIDLEADELDAVECNIEEICTDPSLDDTADEGFEVQESPLVPEDIAGAGDDEPTALTEEVVAEIVPPAESAAEDGEAASDSDELEEKETERAMQVVEDAEVLIEPVEEKDSNLLLIVLAIFTAASSAIYFILRKKYS